MSKAVSALPQAQYSGLVELAEAGLTGMITLRGDLGLASLVAAVQDLTGCAIPAQRRLNTGARGTVLWMSPDELLLVVDYARASEVADGLNAALAAEFATAADVSDARVMLTLTGPQARDVLAKVCPVDFAGFAVGEVRRTRAAQVAAAIWRDGEDAWRLVCFRSVAQYVWDVLATVSKPGGEVGLYR